MKTKKMKIEYRKQTDSETAPWQLLTNVDELLWNGVYALRVTDDDGSHNLPFRLANDDTVTFVVKDHAHDGMLENARTVVQTVTRVDRATGNVLVYNRTRYNAGGTHSWSYWTLAGEGTAAVEIPTASTTSAGAVIVGDGLAVDADGKVSLAAGSVGKQQLTAEVGAQIDSMAEKLQFSASFAVNDGIPMHVGALVENTTPYSGTNFRAYTGKILSNGELLVVNEGYLISTYKVFDGEQEIAFVNNLSLKHFSLDGEHLNYQLEFKKSDTTAFADSELPTVIKYFQRNPIAWNAGSHINNYTAPGVYNIHGNRENVADGLPFENTGAFSARLAVIESGDCVAQQLYLLCADDKESATDVAVRTRNSAGVWSTWRSLDDVTTAQIHDGAVTAEKLSADIVAQINNNTEAIVAERTRAMGQEGLLNSAFEAEKQRAMQAETLAVEKGKELALRALFIAAGAEYNDSGADKTKTAPWGETVTHKAGHYYLNGLGDISEEQMVYIYENSNSYILSVNMSCRFFETSFLGTNICRKHTGWNNANGVITARLMFYKSSVKVARLVNSSWSETSYCFPVNDVTSMFESCTNLKTIIGVIYCNAQIQGLTSMFKGCTSLENFKIYKLPKDFKCESSPVVHKSSILYLIQNAAPTSAITITLHPDAYARLADDADIVAALEAQPLVSLVSA